MRSVRTTIANPFDAEFGAPIHIEYSREFSESKSKLIKELVITCGNYYAARTTNRVKYIGISFTSPMAFLYITKLNDMIVTARKKYDLHIDHDSLLSKDDIPMVVVNGRCFATKRDILHYSELLAWDWEHPDANGEHHHKHSQEEAFKIVFGGRKMEV